jgi:hypothetical protein
MFRFYYKSNFICIEKHITNEKKYKLFERVNIIRVRELIVILIQRF